LMCVPLNKNGHYVARMAVSQKTPRRWSPWEIELVAKVANRCWESVERARAVRSLKESEERLRRITDATQDALWEIDLKTNRLWWSEGAKPLFGHSPGELEIGLEDWYDGIHPEDAAQVKVRFEEFMRNGDLNWVDEYRFRRADGSYVYILDQGRKFFDESGRPTLIAGAMADITERRRVEEALRASEERYRLLTELSPDGVVIAGADGTIHLANRSMQRMLGATPELVVGRNLLDFLEPEYLNRYRNCLNALMTDDLLATQIEAAFRREDGRIVPVEMNGLRFEWTGQPFAQLVIHDITSRRQAEAERERLLGEIEAERNRLRQILEQMPIGVGIVEAPSGRLIFHNREAERLKRHPALPSGDHQEYAQYGPLREDGSSYEPEEQPVVRSLVSGEVIKGEEMRYRRGDGTETFFSVDSAPIHDSEGRMVLAVTTFIDIAERRRAEEALRVSEEQARRQLAYVEAIYATAPVGLCFVDSDLRFLSINERLAEIDGKSVEEHLGRTLREVVPEIAGVIEPSYRRVIETGEPVINAEMSTTSEPGVVRHFIVSYYPIKNGDRRVLGVNAVVVEITQRKKIEEERERLLRQEKAARAEAEAANRMKDEFLATISHELRTPLTSILGWARMLTGGELSEPQSRHALDVIAQSAQSQTRLIEDILDTSRIITGRLKLDAQPVEIERVFQDAVDVIRPSAEAKGIALSAAVEVSDGVVFGDASRLQQALWNLLSNAVKFTNEGGRIEARLGWAEGQIEITISDTGIGIAPQFLPHVFDRFRQADSATTREYGGLGLGLAIVRHIVEMHGGSASATSPGKDQGATFKIRLPPISALRLPQPESRRAPPEEPRARERKATENGHRLDGVRVLLVEDNPDTLEMLKFLFDESGAEVVAAASVTEALKAMEGWRPDALVTDIAMPDRDGYDLIQEVRSRGPERGGQIPAVAVTAYARAEDRVRILAAGFQMHVAKPIDPDELIAVVASLTGHIHS
ncbi:MAG: PAS domain S-box protein, partial [Blastocatellia bacterium]